MNLFCLFRLITSYKFPRTYGFTLWFILANSAYAIEPVQLTAGLQRDTIREFDGIDDFNVVRLETYLKLPLLIRRSYAGNWHLGANLSENRFFITGAVDITRRFYRLSVPIQFFPRRVGRWQYQWHLEPSFYSDESLIDQTSFGFEYAGQGRYFVNRKVAWVVGIQNDRRFGGASYSPILGIESRPNKKIFHHWVFPDIYSELKLNRRLKAKAFLSPSGGNWTYLDVDGETTASFGIHDWNLGLSIKGETKMPFDWVVSSGIKFLGEASVAGNEGSLDMSYFFTLGIQTPIDP